MSLNWVMKDETAKRPFVPLPQERAILASPPRTALSLKSPKPPPNTTTSASASASSTTTSPFTLTTASPSSSPPLDISSPSGILYLTSRRLVYLPATPTPTFQSFSCPLLNLHDTFVTAPWFGPNVVVGAVQPVRDGGLPTPDASPYMLELKFTFNEGGAYDFHAKFAEVRERLDQNRELVREIGAEGGGRHQELHGEQLPAYEERETGEGGRGSGGADADVARTSRVSQAASVSAPEAVARDYTAPPDDAPPGYDEIEQH